MPALMEFSTPKKMQLPQINKFKFSLNSILTVVALVMVLIECYFAYNHLYKNITAEPAKLQSDQIVRVDNASYKTTIEMLDNLKTFVFIPPALPNPNIFK